MSKTIGPWRQLTSELVYQNPWIEVHHQTVTTPAGTAGIYGKVHFKNVAIGIIPVDEHGNTWLVGQHRYTLDEFSWEIPMGGGALESPPLLAAQRELQEETGLTATHWQQIIKLHTSNSITDEVAYVFLAQGLQVGLQQLEASESDLVLRQLPLEEAISLALAGKITDAISVAALLAVKHHLSR